MIGTGLAFALLPILRLAHRDDPAGLEKSVMRHGERFNAHPYMADLALGACARMEEDGEDPEMIRRFKTALGGSLGALGDNLVWAGWLPACVLLGLSLLIVGVPGWLAVIAFLAIYNTGHLSLRVWGFTTGLREGPDVGERLRHLRLAEWPEKIGAGSAVLLGVVVGAFLLRNVSGSEGMDPLWILPAAGGFITGLRGGQGAWRPTLNVTVVILAILLLVGAVR